MMGLGTVSSVGSAVAASGLPGSGLATTLSQGASSLSSLGNTLAGPGGPGTRTMSGASGRVTLAPAANSILRFQPIKFWVNPARISLSKRTNVEGVANLVASSFEEHVKASGTLSIELKDVRIVGTPFTKNTMKTLVDLATPWPKTATGAGSGLGSALGGAGGALGALGALGGSASPSPTLVPGSASSTATEQEYELPKVLFTWGSGLTYTVMVRSVDLNITRFSTLGEPISASVDLSMQESTERPTGQNPTSGGLPGRARHPVVAGDNIVRIAVAAYGDPRAWRAIALANGLDDPLRLAAGRQLYLPGPAELDEVGAGGQFEEVSAA